MVQTQRTTVPPSHASPWTDWRRRRWADVVRFARGQWDAYHRCRECSGEVKFTEDICPHCGISGPVVVPLGVPAAIGVIVVLVLGLLALTIV